MTKYLLEVDYTLRITACISVIIVAGKNSLKISLIEYNVDEKEKNAKCSVTRTLVD